MLYALYCPQQKDKKMPPESEKEGKTADGATAYGAFQFTIERKRHYYGGWHTITATIFPDYQFIDCSEERAAQLKENMVPLFPLSEEVSEFLLEVGGLRHHIPMSRGIIRDGLAHVTEGPLVGFDHRIVRLDKHKRLAWLLVSDDASRDFSRESTSVLIAGLEIMGSDPGK